MATRVGDIIDKMIDENQIDYRKRWRWSWGNRKQCDKLFREIFREVDNTFDIYEHLPEYDEIIEWMSNTNDKGLMLMGDCGRGKSVILNYVIPVLFRIKDRIVMSVHAQDMSKQIPINPRATIHIHRSYMDYLLDTAYPIIDELGIEPMINDYGEKFEGFNLVLNAAERYHRPIFISTNLTVEQIYERYGDRTMDRLTHLCRTVHFKGDSLRK